MEVFLRKQVEVLTMSLAAQEGELQWAREDRDAAQMEREAMERERNTSVRVAMERALEVQGLQEHLMQMEGQPTGEAEGRGRVLGGDALWAELEAARWREDWLANKAASGRVGILRWVQEHWVLLDGASTAFVSIQDELMQGSAVQFHVDSGRVDAGVHGSAPGVAAGDGAIGEVAGGALATQCGGPGVVVGGGG
ncbi:hypothetical protein J132_02486 [Termitomyces sp. J132]|nr:hypothetical protein J132_02486 [Termitomyces sp. J132]